MCPERFRSASGCGEERHRFLGELDENVVGTEDDGVGGAGGKKREQRAGELDALRARFGEAVNEGFAPPAKESVEALGHFAIRKGENEPQERAVEVR